MSLGKLSLFKNQNYNTLKSECLKKDKLFCDETFKFTVQDAVWLRPNDICDNPQFFVDGASRFDVIQGRIGDCWLMVAMANLTMNKMLFQHVVPTDQSFREDYAGIFRFRMWQCGEWVEIVIDDMLPTKNGKLMFVHSKQKNEFWSALLEKAYAKLYGSYEQLSTGGWFCEAMVDFTGGMVESVSLVNPPLNLEKVITSAIEKNSFMCVFMKNDTSTTEEITDQGLVKGHAYSINKFRYVTPANDSGRISLVRLRNPWGKIEWTGAWSDSSTEWKAISDADKSYFGLVTEEDGEFWMSLSDLTKNFRCIDICHLSPGLFQNVAGAQGKVGWNARDFKGEWIKDVNAGGASKETIHMNPQFKIMLIEPDDDEDDLCTIIIALMQKNKTRNVWHRIGFTAFIIDDPMSISGTLSKDYIQSKLLSATTTSFKHTREIVVRNKWKSGVYCIIPSTFGPNHEGQFLLRVFTEKTSSIEEIHDAEPTSELASDIQELLNQPLNSQSSHHNLMLKKLVYKTDEEVHSFFNRIAGKEKEIGWQGLQSLLQFALSPNLGLFTRSSDSRDVKFHKYECRTLIAMLDENRSGKLDFEEFQTLWSKIRLWESVYLRSSKNSEFIRAPELKLALTAAGYRVSSSALGSLVKRYADDDGRFTFNDFIMCAVELETA